MKTLNNYRYVLFAIMVLGFFASFAQNEYGWTMIVYSNLLMGLLTAIEFGKHENAVWKQNKSGIILSALFFIGVVLFFSMVMLLKDELFETIAPYLGFSILGILVLEIVLVIIGNRKTVELTSRSLALESLGLVIILFSSFFKFNHLPGSNALFILGNLILFPLYFSRGIINFFKEYKKGKLFSLFLLLFFLSLSVSAIGYTFKTLHWPFGGNLCLISFILLLVLIVPILLNTKFSYSSEKIGFRKILNKINWTTIFAFIFLNYLTLYVSLQIIGVGPRIYSLANPPAYLKMEEESRGKENPRAAAYYENYWNFLRNRQKAENK